MDDKTIPPPRMEFVGDPAWGLLSPTVRRFEITTPARSGPVLGISEVFGAVHVGRCSLVIRIGGGHLRASREDLLARIRTDAKDRLQHGSSTPVEHVERVVSWLEEEQRSGILEHSYSTASLIVAVSASEAWTWHVGPHGAACGSRTGIRFRSTDLRYPVLHRLGVLKPSALRSPGVFFREEASSIYCIGTPLGYEKLRMRMSVNEVVLVFEQGSLPFGPLTEDPIPIRALWDLEAAWKQGLQGMVIALGCVDTSTLDLPTEWHVSEVPFLAS